MTEAKRRPTELPADNQGFHKIVPKALFFLSRNGTVAPGLNWGARIAAPGR